MRTKAICFRALLSFVALAAACMAPAPAQSVEPPITKDIVDADSGEKLGNITFEWLTTIAGGITDFDLEGFTEADLFPGLFAFPGPAFWEIDPSTGEVSRLVAGFSHGVSFIPPLGCLPPVGGSCVGTILRIRENSSFSVRFYQITSYACTVSEGGSLACERTDGPAIPIALVDPGSDGDGDGVLDDDDNCPAVANPIQTDTDGDTDGDACDADDDDDSVADAGDNCPFDANADQADGDGDGVGDACDGDLDGDGVLDVADACLPTEAGEVVDAAGCSIADLCPCDGDWKNHGKYVSCVSKAAGDFAKAGLIGGSEKGAITSDAAKSSCGKDKKGKK